MSAVWLALGVLISMAFKDAFYSFVTVLESHGHGLAAAQFDVMGDVASIFCVGVSGVEIIDHGFSLPSLLILAGIAIGSEIGTVVGTEGGVWVEQFLDRRNP